MKPYLSLNINRRDLNVFIACLLSFALLIMPSVPVAAAMARGSERQVRGDKSSQTQPAATHTVAVNAPLPAPAPAPFVPAITATKSATLIGDDGDGKADPNASPAAAEKIEYTVTISNGAGATDATGVTFTDTIDAHTTLVPGSVNTQPIADPDTYTASGNIAISIGAGAGVLANDRDPDTGDNTGLTVTQVQGVGANVGVVTNTNSAGRGGVTGKVTLNSNGSFTYEPPPGFIGADSFTYTVSDGSLTDNNINVTINISQMVWFIQNNAAGSTNIGTFSNPFTSIATFNTANAAPGTAPNPKDGDFIALRTGSGTYSETDGINLRAQQKLIGNGVAFNTAFTADANSISAYTTFAGSAGSAPNITPSAGNGVDLAADNTVRGLNVGNSSGFKINGTAVGSPIINAVNLTGAGGALNVSTSGAFGGNVTFGTFESTSSPGANVNLVGVTGTLAVTTTGTGLSGSAAASAAVNVSGGTVTFSYPGAVSKTSGTGALVSVSGGHNTGTLTFGGTVSAISGTGLQFDNADGIYNFSGTTTLNGGDAGIDILNGSGGTFTFSASASITSPSGTAFNVSTGTPNVTYSGSITDNTAGQRAVNIDGTTGGAISIATVTTASTAGGVGNTGININNANGNVTFTTLTMGTSGTRHTAQPVTITNGTGTYGLGTVNIFTNNVTGIGATDADGTLNSTTGTVDAGQGTSVNIDGPAGLTTLGMSFTKLVSDGGTATGLIVRDTNGSFTVTGSGSACTSSATCTGGSLSNKTGAGLGGSGTDGAFIRNAVNVSLTRMNISDNNGNGLFAGSVNGIRIDNCFINSNADSGSGADYLALGFNNETNVHLVNVSGTSLAGANPTAITNSTITNAFEHDVEIDQTTGTLTDFQINSSTINNNGASTQAGNRVLYIINGGVGVTGTLTVQDSTLTGNRVVGQLTAAGIQGTVSAGTQNIRVFRNTLLNNFVAVDVSTSTSGVLNFDISNNGGTGGVANNGASNGRIVGSDSVAVSVFTNANATGSLNGFIQGNTIGTQGVAASGSVVGRGIQFQNEGSVNSKVLISGNIVQGVAGNQELNIQHGIAVAGAAGRSDVTAINNTLRENTSTTRPFNAEILNTGTLCVDIQGNAFANNIGQGGGPSLLRVNDPAGTGTMLVRQLSPTGAVNANELDDANGLTNAQVTVSGAPTFNGGACTQPTTFGPVSSNFIPQRFEPKSQQHLAAETNRQPSNGMAAHNVTEAPQPSFLTRAANAIVAFASEVGSLIEPTVHASAETPRSDYVAVAENSGRKATSRTQNRTVMNHARVRRTVTPVTPMFAGETVTVNIGTLKPNDSVTVKFQVTVNNPPNLTLLNPARVTNQGKVTGTNFADVFTNQLDTNVDLFDSQTTLVSNLNPANQGDSITFTATVAIHPSQSPLPPSPVVPTGTVTFKSDGVDIAGCVNVPLDGSAQAQCTTNALTPPSHNITAVYSGNGNYDTSTSAPVSQTIVACATNPIVTSTEDSGAGTLRDAVANVCNGNTITFDLAGAGPHTITLTTGEIPVAKNVIIKNASGESITVSGNNASRVFNVNSGKTVAIIGLTLSGGSTSGDGGAVFNDGALTIINSLLTGNAAAADGGAISTTATATSLTLINTTISGNTAGGSGGGLITLGGTVNIINSTITNNTADFDDNNAGDGGGIRAHAGTVTLKNTIVSGNFNKTGGSDVADDITGTADTSSFNLVGVPAGLGPLADNGGLTQTHALLPTSAAVEAGSNANLPADTFDLDGDLDTAEPLPFDQRGVGFPRNADSSDVDTVQTVDIGAFELHPSIENIPNQSTNEDTVKNVTFNLGDDTGSLISTVTATSSNTTLVPNANLVITGFGGSGSRDLQITPAANQSGTTTITVIVTATNGRTATDTFDLTVNAVNDAPVANDDSYATNEDTPLSVNAATGVLANDTDGDTLVLTAVLVSGPSNALSFTLNANGSFDYTPNTNFNGQDTFTYKANDGSLDSNVATVTITVNATNDSPTVGANTGITVAEGSTNNTITSTMLRVDDVDNTATQIVFTIGTAPVNGTLKKSGVALAGGSTFTQDDINNNRITYDHNGSETTSDSFTFTVSDGAGGTIGTTTFNITITGDNDAPSITAGGTLNYTENDPATAIDTTITVTDPDSATLSSATVTINVNYVNGQDVLSFTNTANISGSFNAVTGTLSLTGSDTVANYQAALRAVKYNNTSENPSTLPRTVSWSVKDDGNVSSNVATSTINVTAVNDAPVNTVPGPQSTNQNTALTFSAANSNQISVADVDAGSADIQVTLTATNGTVTLASTAGLTSNSGNGTANVSMQGPISAINNAMNGMTFTPTNGFSGAATLTILSNDLGNTGTGGAKTDSDVVNIQVATNVSIQDASVVEPKNGTVNMIFTVTLSAPAPAGGASVNFTTVQLAPALNHATAGQDYTTTSGTVNFAAGEQFKTIQVPVLSDNKKNEANETFEVQLSNPVNATIADGTATGTIIENAQEGTILISELRTSGPNGATDEFVEILNNTTSSITVNGTGGGYGLFKMGATCSDTPVLIGVIPNGTVIPVRGHYLFTGSTYGLADYGGTGNAAGDASLMSDIENDRNVAIFSTATLGSISSANRLDAVGFGANTGGTCDLFREGATLTPLSGSTLEYSYFRDECGKKGNPSTFGNCPTNGLTKDSNVNNDDFIFVDTNATATPAGQRLGAPGPQNNGSPRTNFDILALLLDSSKSAAGTPNRVRDTTAIGPNAATGTMSIRRRFQNNTGGPVTRLRIRVVDISTAFVPGGVADLRLLTSGNITVSVNDSATCTAAGFASTPCNVTVLGTTLETPPAQPLGGGFNSSATTGTITLANPLLNGASVNLQLLLGVQSTGSFKFFFNIEALP